MLNYSTKALIRFAAVIGIFATLNPGILLAFQKGSLFPSIDFSEKTVAPDAPSVVGGDGDFTVTGANTVLNNYTTLAADASTTDASFTVANITDLNSSIPQLGPIAVGDLVMIIQMQGATIDTTDTVNYGSVTSLSSAGLYELVTIGAIAGNTITINGESCITDLRNSYTVAGRTQVIRVPQFRDLTVNIGASVVSPAWNGSSGGVVALQVSRFMTLNGTIDVSAQGFRGGALDFTSSFPGAFFGYRTNSVFDGEEKGEGIAGSQLDYDALGGRFGRGAPANGGGGGQTHNSGGGGGSNGNNGNAWSGQGVMPATPLAAWQLDPGYIANGNALTNSSGGGRGGYSYSEFNQDATLVGPGNILWGGDTRKEIGGLGGRPLTNNPANRLFLGGGGGAGDSSNIHGGAGGRGGGLAFVQAGGLSGTGSIVANGENGFNTANSHTDGAGGGGGGGTVVVSSFALTGVSITANGGNGGNQVGFTGDEAEGPGGAGGGGYIAVRVGSPTRTANGGVGGSTNSTAMTEFPRNGSTDGAVGQNTASVISLPICVAPSSAPVNIIGRVMTASGQGMPRASVQFTDAQGNSMFAITNPFGYFRFNSIPAGQTAIVTVQHKSYTFANPSQVVVPVDSTTEISFTAEP